MNEAIEQPREPALDEPQPGWPEDQPLQPPPSQADDLAPGLVPRAQGRKGRSGRLGGGLGDGLPLLDGGARRGAGPGKFLIVVLILVVLGGAGWFWISHRHATPKRLAGMGSGLVQNTPSAAHPAGAKTGTGKPAAEPAEAASVQRPQASQAAPDAAALSPVTLGALPGIVPTSSAAGAAALALPGASAVMAASQPAALLAAAGPMRADARPRIETVNNLGLPAESVTAQAAKVQELQQRVQHLEDAIVVMQTRLNADGGMTARVAAAGAPVPVNARTRRARRVKTAATPAAAASVDEPAMPPPPTLGAQLLSIDMWGGTPSVVLSSGLPGDSRTRTLRPGDTLNGVTLRQADPATGEATFVSGGRSFTLSLRDGG